MANDAAVFPLDGIDVSRWQGEIDFTRLKDVPLKFFAMQVGGSAPQREQGILATDEQFKRNQAFARSLQNKWLIIYYFVPVAYVPWTTQLEWLLATIGPLGAHEALMFDIEYPWHLDLGWPFFRALMAEAEKRIGRPVFHYGGAHFPSLSTAWIHNVPERPKWVANYNTLPSGIANLTIYQWGGSKNGATVPGITTGRVDSNAIVDYEHFARCFNFSSDTIPDQMPELNIATALQEAKERRLLFERAALKDYRVWFDEVEKYQRNTWKNYNNNNYNFYPTNNSDLVPDP